MGGSEDEGELVALSSRAAVALDARAVRARGLALWVTRSDSELSSTLGPPLQYCIHWWPARRDGERWATTRDLGLMMFGFSFLGTREACDNIFVERAQAQRGL